MKLKDLTDLQWSYICTAISADILDNKITLPIKVVKDIFIGKDAIDPEDLLSYLVLPNSDWETYIRQAILEGIEIDREIKGIIKPFAFKDKIIFCRVCEFDGAEGEFEHDEEDPEFIACPECGSLSIGTRRFREDDEN